MKKKSQKFIKNTKKQAKKRVKFLMRHPLLVPVSLFFVVVFFGLGMFVAVGASTEGAQDKRIVNVYVDDEKQTVSTRAKTVGDLIERLDIELIDEDIVEPSNDTQILEDETQVNIYRARPVAVIDGNRIITVLSAHQSAKLVANDAGVDLHPQDEVVFERSVEPNILDSSTPEQVVITRSVPVQMNIYGVVTSIRTTASTVGEFLDQQGVVVEAGATVQPSDPSTPISKGMLIGVNKVGIVTESITEVIPHAIEYRDDRNMTVGESRVENEGVDGEQAVVYEITQKDGQEVDRRAIQTVVTVQPVAEIRIRGTKPATLSSSVNVSADKASLMAAAGIAASDYAYVDFIVGHESGWRPGAHNSSSGAYGLCQSLPASKMASAGGDYLTNPVTQLRWCSGYANGRYGGWAGAYNAWLAQKWW